MIEIYRSYSENTLFLYTFILFSPLFNYLRSLYFHSFIIYHLWTLDPFFSFHPYR